MSRDSAGSGAPQHYPYCGDDAAAVIGAVHSLEAQRDATSDLADRSAAQLPQVRDAWPVGSAGDTAYATLRHVDDFVSTVPPALASASRALVDYRGELLVGRTRTDELNAAYAVLAPLQERVHAFGTWIEVRNEAAYDRAATELQVAGARLGYGSTQDLDAAYQGVVKRVTSARDGCAAELAALARQQQLPQGRPGMSIFAAGLAGALTLAQLLARAGFGGMPSSAADVKRFWDTLSPTERQQLLAADPQLWGNTNGVPCVDRDYANRIVLAAELGELDAIFAQHGWPPPRSVEDIESLTADQLFELGWGPHPGDWINLNEAGKEQCQSFKDALATAATLRRAADGIPAFLYAYDSSAYHGEGRAAIAFGNPDLAEDIAVCVPGLESRVSKIDQVGGDAYNLYLETRAADRSRSLATIAWQGYDAPEFDNVMFQGNADAGARLLAADVSALNLTHTGGDPRITVVAHSYGSTTTGLSLQRYGLADSADQVILIGSPGVGGSADSVSDLHLRPDQLFVGSASRDLVTTAYGQLGADPAEDTFGGTRFKAENVNRVADNRNPFNVDDHSLYYDVGTHSESLYAMADIVSGHADLLDDHDMIAVGRHRYTGGDIEAGFDYTEDPEWVRKPTSDHEH